MKGLTLIKDAITVDQEEEIVSFLDNQDWDNRYKRRTQYYGYDYEYRTRGLTKIGDGSMPSILLSPQIMSLINPDAIIVNEYYAGQGITPHVDASCWGNRIVIVSLLSDTVMMLHGNLVEVPLQLPRRSILILEDDARYKIKHSISHQGERRVSLTYRTISPSLQSL
jgi:alkylated DNA repair dioxygenase AlkB